MSDELYSAGSGESGPDERRAREENWPQWVEELPNVPTASFEQAIVRDLDAADRLGREGYTLLQYWMLEGLMDMTRHPGRVDWQIRILTEMRHVYRRDPDVPNLRKSILWYLKWVSTGIVHRAEIPLEMIDRIHDEMQRAFEVEGESLRPVWAAKLDAAMSMGRRETARELFWRCEAAEESDREDCEACRLDVRAQFFLFNEKDEEKALETVKALLSVDSHCDYLPAIVSQFIPFVHKRGLDGLAEGLHERAIRVVRRVPNMMWAVAPHLIYVSMRGRWAQGRRLAASGLYRVRDHWSDTTRLRILRAAGFWAGLTCVADPVLAAELTLPRRCLHDEPANAKGTLSLPEAAERCLALADEIAGRLDRRNGNDHFGSLVQSTRDSIAKFVAVKKEGREDRRA